MKKIILLLITIIFLSVSSCYYDSEEALFPKINTSCDTVNVTYSGAIKTMMDNYCNTCHASQIPILTTYINVQSNSDRIYGDIAHKNGYNPMPKNATMLDSCLIKQFAVWIKLGKLNN